MATNPEIRGPLLSPLTTASPLTSMPLAGWISLSRLVSTTNSSGWGHGQGFLAARRPLQQLLSTMFHLDWTSHSFPGMRIQTLRESLVQPLFRFLLPAVKSSAERAILESHPSRGAYNGHHSVVKSHRTLASVRGYHRSPSTGGRFYYSWSSLGCSSYSQD